MESKYFLLGKNDDNKLIKVVRIIFGTICIIIAIYWLVFNLKALKTDWTLWITIIFLTGFGFYQIWSAIGKATRFIEFDTSIIILKKNAIMPAVEMAADEMEKIEIFPLNIVFYFKSKKRILLRFGTTYHDINELILDEIIGFAESNNLPFEVIEEKL